jgi:hypothetical protein
MRKLRLPGFLILALVLLSASILVAAQTGTVKVRGQVKDPSGGIMGAVDVRVIQGSGNSAKVIKQGQTNAQAGEFDLDVPPGQYTLEVTAPDFEVYKKAIRVAANMDPLSVTLELVTVGTVVDVNADNNQASLDPNSSLTGQVLTGNDLLELPDDLDDLQAYLLQLAGIDELEPDGSNLIVDGIAGAPLPPKDTIAEIRIINNPFSAEYNGRPTIQIVTKSGTGVWRGGASFAFNNQDLNALPALSKDGTVKPKSMTRNFQSNMQGPIVKDKFSAGFSVRNQETDQEAGSLRAFVPQADGSTLYLSNSIISPRLTRGFNIQNASLSVIPNHRITFNAGYTTIHSQNTGVGNLNLPERATEQKNFQSNFSLSDQITLNSRMVDTFSFSTTRSHNRTIPSTGIAQLETPNCLGGFACNVQDAFSGGTPQSQSDTHTRTYQIQNQLRMTLGSKWQLTTSMQSQYSRNISLSENNAIGTFTFRNISDYLAQTPLQFTQTVYRDPINDTKTLSVTTFAQGEYRATAKAQISMGVRYALNLHASDLNNVAPTLGLSYQLARNTVVRAGGQMTYQSEATQWENLHRNDGSSRQWNVVISNPTYPDPFNGGVVSQLAQAASFAVRSEKVVAPYNITQTYALERSGLPRNMRVSVQLQVSRGVHQQRTRNINAPYPGTPLSDALYARWTERCLPFDAACLADKTAAQAQVDSMRPLYPNFVTRINETEWVGTSSGKTVNIQYSGLNNVRLPFYKKLSVNLNGSYRMTWAYDSGSQPVDSYDISGEWARTNVSRHQFSTTFRITAPFGFTASTSLSVNSGRPYNITTGIDNNGDSNNNDRPIDPVTGKMIARNSGTGPTIIQVGQLSITRRFYLGGGGAPKTTTATGTVNTFAEPQRGGGGGGGGFGGGGGGNGGGGGGGFGGTNNNPNARTMTLTANITNPLNSTYRQNIVGNLSSPFYGQTQGGSGGGRKVTVTMSFNFPKL